MAQQSSIAKTTRITLDTDGKPGNYTPRLHVLMSDGRVTEFRETIIVIPESPRDEADTQVYGMLVNGRGEAWVNEKGERILVPALPLMLRGEDSADMPLTYKEVAKRAGISTSGVKRAVRAGKLPAPHGIEERSVRFELGVVKGWIEEQRKKRRTG